MNANTAVCCVRETHCKRKGINRVNVNEWKTIYHAYANCAKPNWLNEHRNRRIHKTGSVLPTNSMYFTFMQSSAQTDRQTNEQDTHHCDLGRYRDSDSKMFAGPHLRMAHFAGQGPGLCYSPAELPVWHRRRARFILRLWLVPRGGWRFRHLRGKPAGWRPRRGPEATSCSSGKPHAALPRPPARGARQVCSSLLRGSGLQLSTSPAEHLRGNTWTARSGTGA